MIGSISPRDDGRRAALHLLGLALSRPPPSGAARQKILVVRPDHLGDLLFLTPALSRLRRGFPDAEIVGLVGPWGLPVLQGNQHLNRLIAWDFPWFNRRPRRSSLGPYWSLVRLARRLRAERFDLALQFRADFWWGALAARLAGVTEQIGFDAPSVRPFLTRALPLLHGGHAAEENLRLAEAVAGPGGGERLEFPISDAERRRALDLLGPAAAGRPLVALQSGTGAPVKRWPIERLAQVGARLRADHGVSIVAIGGPGERDQVRTLVQQIGPDTIGLAGVTTVGELAAVLERCALALGPDSGPLHLAVAVGTPTIHLFGPADPRRFGPYGDPCRHRVIRSTWPCCPCDQLEFPPAELPAHDCTSRISVDEVVSVADELLGGLGVGSQGSGIGDGGSGTDGNR